MQTNKDVRVLGLFGGDPVKSKRQPGGCEAYRIILPFTKMREAGYTAEWMPLATAYRLARNHMVNSNNYNVFVLQRMLVEDGDAKPLEFVEKLQRANQVVVCEWDDDYTNEHRDVTSGFNAVKLLEACDAATASTPGLAAVMRRYNQNVHVLPNCIWPAMWEKYTDDAYRLPTTQCLTVGLVGTTTHYNDWLPLADAMPKVLAKHPEVKFVLGGYVPDYFADLPGMISLAPVPFAQYPMITRQIDIGLAPLDYKDGFNDSKSDVKALEYSVSRRRLDDGSYGGAAVIATDHKVYRRSCSNRHNALLVRNHSDADEWAETICTLIEDVHLRRRLQKNANRWVAQNRNINTAWPLWARAYSDMLANRKEV